MALTHISPDEPRLKTNLRSIVYGNTKLGKTTYGLTAGDCLYLDLEDGAERSITRSYQDDATVVKAASWPEVLEATETEIEQPTIVVDTATRAVTMVGQHILDTHPEFENHLLNDRTSMKYSQAINAEFARWYEVLKSSGKNLVFICQAQSNDTPSGMAWHLKVRGANASLLADDADQIAMLVQPEEDKRTLIYEPMDLRLGGDPAQIGREVLLHPAQNPYALRERIAATLDVINEREMARARQQAEPVEDEERATVYKDFVEDLAEDDENAVALDGAFAQVGLS